MFLVCPDMALRLATLLPALVLASESEDACLAGQGCALDEQDETGLLQNSATMAAVAKQRHFEAKHSRRQPQHDSPSGTSINTSADSTSDDDSQQMSLSLQARQVRVMAPEFTEFVINNAIGIHPKALLNYDTIDADTKAVIDAKIKGYSSPVEFYVSKIAEGVATLAASVYPKRIIVRLSDFKSNEYKSLIGGEAYEPDEENPMIGFRGCGRYADPAFEECFALELQAMKRVREDMGMTNVELMIPFVRTLDMAADVLDILKKNGLERGVNDLKVNMMAELPSNVFLAEEFLDYFDGFSIGSNDLTQLTLGLDRDSGLPRVLTRRTRL
ncbi:unnamed protein product [Prorocentrum cordatum]|uniref:PEP-utilising enzyme C-terminal domain-containing protein n=1 Tax=Prorocentrum cordatum TaxID=2364126 RepID=A0ABN9UJS5_9DINO|nr:unnamed protein product [Polarella glacialis]